MRTGIAALREQDFKSQYRDYLNRLDARAVLDHYGAEHAYDLVNSDGTTEVVHSCLLDTVERHHAHGDQNPSAACNIDKKLYVCYSYWGGDLIHLIMKMEGKDSPEEVAGIINDFLTGVTKEEDVFAAEIAKMMETAPAGAYAAELPSYSEKIIAPWAFIHPYLAERGIDAGTASFLDIGWDETDNRITIPHFWNGKLVGWQKRSIPPRPGQWPGTDPQVPKYRSTSGFPKSQTLYGWDYLSDAPDRLIVVESPFSVIKATALGVPGVVATFGAKVSGAQMALLHDFKRVYVWMDNDTKSPAGRIAERRLVNYLYRHTFVDVVASEPDRDLGDCRSAEEVELKLASAEPASIALARYEQEKRRS